MKKRAAQRLRMHENLRITTVVVVATNWRKPHRADVPSRSTEIESLERHVMQAAASPFQMAHQAGRPVPARGRHFDRRIAR